MLRNLFLFVPLLLLVHVGSADELTLEDVDELTAEEGVSITGYWAEVFVKEGEILTSECKRDKGTWWSCNILVKVTKPASSTKQWQGGIWTCTYGLWPIFHKNGWFNPRKIQYQCIAGQKGI